ncbi:MAG: hypothetical protein JNM69_28495 [Archangium sp.]|nr:hypothetical protein [Archangium sp.]
MAGINPISFGVANAFVTDLNVKNKTVDNGTSGGTVSQAFIGPTGMQGGNALLPSPLPKLPSEDGHGTDPRQAAIDKNKEITAANAPVQKEIDALEKEQAALNKLFDHIDAKGDGVLTWDEINRLATTSGVPEVKDAAIWLLNHPQVYEALKATGSRWTMSGGDANQTKVSEKSLVGGWGAGRIESAGYRAALQARIDAKKELLKPLVEVPPAPGAAPTTETNASTGTPNAGGSPPPSTAGAPSTSPLTTGSSPGLSGLAEGIDGIQAKINGLVEEMKAHPEKASAIQAEISQLSNQLQSMSAMMNAIFTMQSNLSKMLSEMAMTAIRNMR